MISPPPARTSSTIGLVVVELRTNGRITGSVPSTFFAQLARNVGVSRRTRALRLHITRSVPASMIDWVEQRASRSIPIGAEGEAEAGRVWESPACAAIAEGSVATSSSPTPSPRPSARDQEIPAGKVLNEGSGVEAASL